MARGGDSIWVREHRAERQELFSPIGVVRGPCLPYNELWELRMTEGVTRSGRRFTLTDSWMAQGSGKTLKEPWTGRTSFFAKRHRGFGKDALHLDTLELTAQSQSSRINNFGDAGSRCQNWSVGYIVRIMGHGDGVLTGIGCCGHKGLFEVQYKDGTKYHVRGNMCIKRFPKDDNVEGEQCMQAPRWADVVESDV